MTLIKTRATALILASAGIIFAPTAAMSQFIVFDIPNTVENSKTATATQSMDITTKNTDVTTTKILENNKELLENNKEILKTVNKTYDAITGDRDHDAGSMKKLATGNGFSVCDAPNLSEMAKGVAQSSAGDTAAIAANINNAMQQLDLVQKVNQTVQQITDTVGQISNVATQINSNAAGAEAKSGSNDVVLSELTNNVGSVGALVRGTESAVRERKAAFESASHEIGMSVDLKGSIDQNSQLQLQAGLTLNEMIGVMNGAVSSLQVENMRRLTEISNTRKALRYEQD